MIALLGVSAITMSLLQAAVSGPTNSFRGCLRDAATKASTEKVGADAIESYLRTACTVEMSSLKSALVEFRLKNGMSRKAAASDADMTVSDYLATPVERYQFLATKNGPQPGTTAPVVQAASPQQPKP